MKPREFIIQNTAVFECEWGQVIVELPGKIVEKDFKDYGKIHVIEKSAFDKAIAALKDCCRCGPNPFLVVAGMTPARKGLGGCLSCRTLKELGQDIESWDNQENHK